MTDTDDRLLQPVQPPMQPIDHFLPDHDAWGSDLRQRIHQEIRVPIEPAIWAPYTGQDEAAFDFLRTQWLHFNCEGVLTQQRFNEARDGAIRHFVATINGLGVLRPARIFSKPPTDSRGVAYHDWLGEEFPFDIRVIQDYGVYRFPEKPTHCDWALQFQLCTLVKRGYDCAVPYRDTIPRPQNA